jgi:hypothetical protein
MSETDRELDAAWRAASREEPPAPLDAAIRAAARRAVDAGPARRARHMRWWPLAAAATVAAIAVGIVQLTPPEQVTPTIVADSSRLASAMKKDSGALTAPAPPAMVAPARSMAEPAREAAGAQETSNALRKQLAPAPAPPQSGAGVALEQKNVAEPSRSLSTNISAQQAAAPERDSARKSKVETAAAPAEAAPPVARSEPFPATPPDTKLAANAPMPAAAPAADAAAKPVAAPSRAALAARADEAQPAAPALLGKVADNERAKDAAPRPADEWIKLIRRLKTEGRNEEAAKELAAFRAAYKERSDALLPADLREPKPQ